MIRRFRCNECGGKGSIPVAPSGPQSEWSSRRCGKCDGQGYVEVDSEAEIKMDPVIGPDGLEPTPPCNAE